VEVTLLRCVKGLVLTVLLLAVIVGPSFAAVQAIQTYVDSTWSNTVYYMASLSGYYGKTVGYDDVTIHITAIDEYTLYVNGAEIGTDDNWETVEEYVVTVADNVIDIGVKVVNHGRGLGNGIILDVTGGSDQLGSTTRVRDSKFISGELQEVPIAWWCFDSDTYSSLFGEAEDWYAFTADLFTDTSKTKLMRRAMVGKMGSVNYTFNPGVEVITGYLNTEVDIGYTEGGGISLRRIEGENLALGKPCEYLKLVDADLSIGFQYMSRALNDTKYVDLGRIFRIDKMTLFTGGTNVAEFDRKSFRGYSVEISLDEFRWEEVGVLHEIGVTNADEGGYDNYSVKFPPEWARYVRYKVTETRIEMPNIGELMVFGIGHVLEAKYESPWIDFGSADTYKNFGMIEWDGDIPDGTSLTIQTQTKNGVDSDTPSLWSDPISAKSFEFASPEPATHFRYRVNLQSQDTFRTPTFKELTVNYSIDDQPVSAVNGFVTPTRVAMGADSTFTYVLSYDLVAGEDIDRLVISVPGQAKLNSIHSSDTDTDLTASEFSTVDTLYVSFATPVTDSDASGADTLYVSFNTKLLRSSHTFDAFLFSSSNNDGIGPIKAWENRALGSNTVMVSTILKDLLTDVKAIPKVFTPNGDNKNDFTVIEFTLAKVETNVVIKVYNTAGKLITTIADENMGPRAYSVEKNLASIMAAKELPGYWDGTDEDGDLVPPGIYIFQVVAETDEDDVIEGDTVVVAY